MTHENCNTDYIGILMESLDAANKNIKRTEPPLIVQYNFDKTYFYLPIIDYALKVRTNSNVTSQLYADIGVIRSIVSDKASIQFVADLCKHINVTKHKDAKMILKDAFKEIEPVLKKIDNELIRYYGHSLYDVRGGGDCLYVALYLGEQYVKNRQYPAWSTIYRNVPKNKYNDLGIPTKKVGVYESLEVYPDNGLYNLYNNHLIDLIEFDGPHKEYIKNVSVKEIENIAKLRKDLLITLDDLKDKNLMQLFKSQYFEVTNDPTIIGDTAKVTNEHIKRYYEKVQRSNTPRPDYMYMGGYMEAHKFANIKNISVNIYELSGKGREVFEKCVKGRCVDEFAMGLINLLKNSEKCTMPSCCISDKFIKEYMRVGMSVNKGSAAINLVRLARVVGASEHFMLLLPESCFALSRSQQVMPHGQHGGSDSIYMINKSMYIRLLGIK